MRSRVAGAGEGGALHRGRAGQARRSAGHHRSRSVRRRGRPRAGAGRRRAGAPELREERAPAREAPVGRKRDRAARARRARQRRAGGRCQPARRAGCAHFFSLEPFLHPGARAGLGPRRQARDHRRQPGRRRSRRTCSYYSGLREPHLRQLRRRRACGPTGSSRWRQGRFRWRRKPSPTAAASSRAGCSSSTTRSTRKSGTVRVRAVFDNKDGSLIPGQFVKLRMGKAKSRERAAGERARDRHRPEQALRDRGRPGQQGDLARGHARRHRQGPAHRHRGPRAPASASWSTACSACGPARCSHPQEAQVNFSNFFIDRPIFAGVLSVADPPRRADLARPAADLGVSRGRAALGGGARELSRREPEGDRRDRLHAARGADQRRREHALHEQPGDHRRHA